MAMETVVSSKRLPVVPASVAASRKVARFRPEDGAKLSDINVTEVEEVARIVVRARDAAAIWSAMPFAARRDALTRAARSMLDARAEVLQLMREETGKMEVDALMSEALGPLDQVSSWAKVIERETATKRASLNRLSFPGKRAVTHFRPRGVIGVIAPWNYPLANLFRNVIPALLCGNAVVLKPSEYATRTAMWAVEQIAKCIPSDVLQIVPGDRETAVALIESGVDACVFTGSVRAGKDVAERCARLQIPCSAEMGGKDGAIVMSDCDLGRTAAGITHWALHNAGQSCGAVEIAYVENEIADAFVSRLRDAWSRLRSGAGRPGDVDVSPLANARQFELVHEHVRDAVAHGAKLVLGGEACGSGYTFAPTLLDHCRADMKVVSEETFGPVLAIVRVASAAEAIRQINSSRYGLTASIWTADIARAERLAADLRVGVVTINNHSITGAMVELPWSGLGDTGTGVANSSLSLSTFVRPHVVLVDENSKPELFWMPFDADLFALGNLLADAQNFKLREAWRIPGLLKKRVDTVRKFFR